MNYNIQREYVVNNAWNIPDVIWTKSGFRPDLVHEHVEHVHSPACENMFLLEIMNNPVVRIWFRLFLFSLFNRENTP